LEIVSGKYQKVLSMTTSITLANINKGLDFNAKSQYFYPTNITIHFDFVIFNSPGYQFVIPLL
jgi:hypothetical protein